jgi:hypothetical protein
MLHFKSAAEKAPKKRFFLFFLFLGVLRTLCRAAAPGVSAEA